VAEALERAEKGLEGHREAGLVTMTRLLGWLEAAVVEKATDSAGDVYRVAAQLLDMAGFFETGPFYQATFSLCDIADRMQSTGQWDWPSVAVHVGALRLIMADGCRDSENSRTILKGLEAVAHRLG
jgi:proteasome lid subunit RPN8/RPN11